MSKPPARGLGRGISALLGEVESLSVAVQGQPAASSAPTIEGGPKLVPIELLRRNGDQPRRRFVEADLEELADSIRERGVLQPILVRPQPGASGEYQIVAGERRWRASQRAGLHEVPVLVRDDLGELEVLEIAIIENVQRADLDPLEEASAYQSLIERFGRTQDAVAKTVGKSRSHVANTLRLLALPESVKEHMIAGRLTAGHARALATAPGLEALAQQVVDRGLSVRDAEALARRAHGLDAPSPSPSAAPSAPSRPRGKDADTRALEQDLSESLGLQVEIDHKGSKGEVRIVYKSLEQLDEICRRLSRI